MIVIQSILRVKYRGSRTPPGSPMVKTPSFHYRGTGSVTDQGSKLPHTTWHGQNKMSVVISWELRAEHTLRKYLITQLTLDRLGF